MVNDWFPTIAQMKKFLDFQPEIPKEFHSEPSPCACSKEELIALDGEFCEHGYAHGPARAAKILSQKSAAIKSMTEADEEARRTDSLAQAERVSK